MRFLDLRRLEDAAIECELCIVGSGPAGAALAREFAGTQLRVLVVESGDREARPELAGLNEIESVGAHRQPDQTLVRARGVGGTSQIWTGRCGPLAEIDFEARSWVPLSGWPFERRALAEPLRRASLLLGLLPVDYEDLTEDRPERAALRRALAADDVTLQSWQFSEDASEPGAPWRAARSLELPNGDNLQLLLHATAVEIRPDPNGSRIESVEVASLTGRCASIRARVFVLCAGAIETPRLLLASRSVTPDGLGNRHGVVGRYLTDHPRCTLGQLDPLAAHAALTRYGFHRVKRDGRVRQFLRGLALSPALQRRERLLDAACWLCPIHAQDDPWDALKRLRATAIPPLQKLGAAKAIVAQPQLFGHQLRRRWLDAQPAVPKADRLDVMCDVEQAPDASSRLTLSDQRDALGVPRARLDWRIGELEGRTVQRFAQVVDGALRGVGLPALVVPERVRTGRFEPLDFIDAAHPSGTTRMAADPRHGVVDPDCRVHGIDRLYIAGASVFPTNGHMNPTLTLVALALRLADRLKQGPLKSGL